MSRRQHFLNDESYTDWLKSIGCVLYLPLGASGDLQDRISGESLTFTGASGTVDAVWSDTEQMYLFTGPGYHVKSHTLNNGWTASTFPNNEFTVLTTFKKGSSSSGNGSFLCCGNYIPMGGAVMQKGSSVISNWNSSLYKCAYALSSSGRWLYDNGALYSSYSAYAPFLPANWGGYEWFVGGYNSNNSGRKVFLKDVLVFNNILNLSTIRKIQGYE